MDNAQRTIKDAWTFGIAFTSACRMYRREPSADVLALICRIYEQFLSYLDNASILCTARDFQPIVTGIPQDTATIPSEQEEHFRVFRERVMAECMNRAREEESLPFWKIGESMQCISNSVPPRGIFQNNEQFEAWAEEHIGQATKCCVKPDDVVPLPEEFVEDFNQLCFLMVRYSVGRHTHMPDTAADFVVDNIEHICNETVQKILETTASAEDSCWCRMRYALKDKFIAQSSKQR